MSAPDVVIVDYGVGNLRSVLQACLQAGANPRLTADPAEVRKAGAVILPGVGAFPAAMRNLEESGLGDAVMSRVNAGVPLLGICLGMQLLFEESSEMGHSPGLALIPGKVERIVQTAPRAIPVRERVKETHIGWKSIRIEPAGHGLTLFQSLSSSDAFYFLHTYAAFPSITGNILATTKHGKHSVVSIVSNNNILGIQFHPEKSGVAGIRMLKNFFKGAHTDTQPREKA